MRLSFAAILLTGVFATTAAWAAPPKCLKTNDIKSTSSKDGKILKFVMKDGKVLYNHLQGICPGLRFNGFVWVIRGPEEVCAGQQSLRVIDSGETCVLGKFSTTPKPAANTGK
jgi:hypothetical protein